MYLNANFSMPGTVRVTANNGRILISLGEAPHLITFSLEPAVAEALGQDVIDTVAELSDATFGPVHTFGIRRFPNPADLKLVTE